MAGFTAPRAWAFTLLGLDGYCRARPNDTLASACRVLFADRLLALLASAETPDWVWFEPALAYDNARLCQALILTGLACEEPSYVNAGLRTLRWLVSVQTAPLGYFRPVGSASFGAIIREPRIFDQQPLEAAATISACHAAAQANDDRAWGRAALTAFSWFFGVNDLATALLDETNGSCRDGLHPDRANENRGAESTLAYLMALADMKSFTQMALRPPVQMIAPMVAQRRQA